MKEHLLDKRVVQRALSEGLVDKEVYQRMLDALPDVSHKLQAAGSFDDSRDGQSLRDNARSALAASADLGGDDDEDELDEDDDEDEDDEDGEEENEEEADDDAADAAQAAADGERVRAQAGVSTPSEPAQDAEEDSAQAPGAYSSEL